MLELEKALETILASISAPKTEIIPLAEAHRRIVGEKILASTDLPPFDNSAVDGYAVRARDVASANAQNPVSLHLAGRIVAGEIFSGQLSRTSASAFSPAQPSPPGPTLWSCRRTRRRMRIGRAKCSFSIPPNHGKIFGCTAKM